MCNVCSCKSSHLHGHRLFALIKWKPRWKQADTIKMFTPFQKFSDSFLKIDPFSWFREFAPPIETMPPLFAKMGTNIDVRFGWECWVLANSFFKFGNAFSIYPHHGRCTDLEFEKNTNCFQICWRMIWAGDWNVLPMMKMKPHSQKCHRLGSILRISYNNSYRR